MTAPAPDIKRAPGCTCRGTDPKHPGLLFYDAGCRVHFPGCRIGERPVSE